MALTLGGFRAHSHGTKYFVAQVLGRWQPGMRAFSFPWLPPWPFVGTRWASKGEQMPCLDWRGLFLTLPYAARPKCRSKHHLDLEQDVR